PVAGNGEHGGGGWATPLGYREWTTLRGNHIPSDFSISSYALNGQCYWRLCLGTDNQPVSINDFGLYNRTGDGTRANYLNESGRNFTTQVTDKPTSRFSILTNFTNNSGADITLRE